MQSHTFSGLARPLNLHYNPNRIVAICITLLLVISFLYFTFFEGLVWTEAGKNAVLLSLSAFLSWALARELSPDKEKDALLALALGAIGAWFFTDTALLLLFLLLMSFRLVNRSTGQDMQAADYVVFLALLALLLYFSESIFAPLILAAAFWADSYLPGGVQWHKLLAAALLIIAGVAFFLIRPLDYSPHMLPQWLTMLIIVVATAFAFYIRQTQSVRSVGDFDERPLVLQRIRSVQLLALLVVVINSLWMGLAGFVALWPLWAAISGLLLGNLASAFYKKK